MPCTKFSDRECCPVDIELKILSRIFTKAAYVEPVGHARWLLTDAFRHGQVKRYYTDVNYDGVS